MTKHQTEQLYQLTHHPLWPVYVAYKAERLDKLHEQLEWIKEDELKKVQGQIVEVKADMGLAEMVDELLLRN